MIKHITILFILIQISLFGQDSLTMASPVLSDSIVVTSPNGGEKWLVGSTQTITWTSDISFKK